MRARRNLAGLGPVSSVAMLSKNVAQMSYPQAILLKLVS